MDSLISEITENCSQSKQVIPIMHCFDNNYVIPAAVSFYSMLQHANPVYDYKLYVLHSDITWQNQQKLCKLVAEFPNVSLEFIDMTHRFDNIWKKATNKGHLAKEVLYKLIASSIFPNYDKLIITDVDVVFEGDIAPSFFSFDKSDSVYIAGIKHVCPRNSWLDIYYKNYVTTYGKDALNELKICGGFLVLNLHQLRENKMEEVFLQYLEKNVHLLLQQEQDVLNFCIKSENIVMLPLNYVLCSYSYDLFPTEESYSTDRHYTADEIKDALENPIQLHYATSKKPWNTPNITKADKWFSALRKTNFHGDYVKINQNISEQINPNILWEGYCEPDFPVMVSILCCTYNHASFIKNTLEYIVNQKTDYKFEIIVSDDASTDDTQKIISEYRLKYPHLFKKCILRKENVGIGQNYYEALQLVEGKYLAFCDGDDYWISTHKLQWQIELMETNTELSICCSSFISHEVETGEEKIFDVNNYIKSSWIFKDSYDLKDLLYCRFIASCTLMIRWRLHGRVPEFIQNSYIIDFQLTLIHSAFGRIFVINEPVLAQYNSSKDGIFLKKQESMIYETAKILREVNQYFKFWFNSNITEYLHFIKTSAILKSEPKKEESFTKYQSKKDAKKNNNISVFHIPSGRQFLWMIYNKFTPKFVKRFYRKIRYKK